MSKPSESFVFNPHWIPDPAPWIFDLLGQEQQKALAKVSLQMTRAVLTAQLQAVQDIEKVMSQSG